MLMQNEFDNRDEVIFIEYDKVIKSSDQFLLHKIGGELSHVYEDFLDLTDVFGKNMDNCMTLTQMTKKFNLFEALPKIKLPDGWFDDYVRLYKIYDEMYKEAHLLDIGHSVYSLVNQKFTKKIYFWSSRKDERIVEDLIERHDNKSKMAYVYGDLNEILNSIDDKITMFMIADLRLVDDILKYKDVNFTEILYARYRFNQFKDSDGKYKPLLNPEIFKDKMVKISDFSPYKLRAENFSQMDDIIK